MGGGNGKGGGLEEEPRPEKGAVVPKETVRGRV